MARDGLSKGELAATIVLPVLASVAIVALLVWWLRRRRRLRSRQTAGDVPLDIVGTRQDSSMPEPNGDRADTGVVPSTRPPSDPLAREEPHTGYENER